MPDPRHDRLKALSPRQRECLRLVAQGLEGKEIGRALGISDLTVKNHLSAARTALGVARSIDAARMVAADEAGASGTSAPPGIADRSYYDVEAAGQSDRERDDETETTTRGLADASGLAPPPTGFVLPLPYPARRGQRNALSIPARLAIVVLLTVLLIAAVGFFVEASRGLRF
ncbi:hypothetical protein GCM10011380_25930 [Sphingomonas metalli]|uniref:HTH luxR-type domain-containing protein n=1 Tax=Sphingomonas metalli TaxID=1779358 RepID=A0A916T870_9SPHN|nr:helix-turn-helix transcriptional regulator [Sphingomonas metalli]GGB35342.1 hypothetical protein GCM10011380_25930 [Sphingomonas metalli]